MISFNENIATLYGVNAAIVAQYLAEASKKHKNNADIVLNTDNHTWCRCGSKAFTGEYHFLSKHQTWRAMEKLVNNGVIIKKKLKKAEFDHTNWYAFTEYGNKLLLSKDDKYVSLLSRN
jgi:hypothetical protein